MRVCPTCYAHEQDNAHYCGLCGTQLLEIKAAEEQEDPMIGQIVNRKFYIERMIGRGGMGDVYLARDQVLDRDVAIKFLNHRFRSDETVIIRFHKEARSYARVNHANAVTLYDYGQLSDGRVYLIMEFVDGLNLSDYVEKSGPIPHNQGMKLAVQLAEALLAAHTQGVIHRDLKPDNIMLLETSLGRLQAKILDFGIAKILDDHTEQLTEVGMIFGTPEFMSPEQAQGFEVDQRTDVYAFGMLLFFMFTECLPFEGKNKLVVLNQQIHDTPPRPSTLCPEVGIDSQLEMLIMCCIEKDRHDRYLSFEAILADLDRIRDGEKITLGSEFVIQLHSDSSPPEFVDLDAEQQYDTGDYTAATATAKKAAGAGSATPTPSNSDPSTLNPSTHQGGSSTNPGRSSQDSGFQIGSISPNKREIGAPSGEFSFGDLKTGRGRDDGFSMGGSPSDDGFSLGGSRDDWEAISHNYESRPSGGGIGLFIFLLLIAGGGFAAFMMMSEEEDPAPKQAGETTTSPADALSHDPIPTEQETLPSEAPPIQVDPPPLPAAFSLAVRQRTVARAIIARTQSSFDNTDFDTTKRLAKSPQFKESSLPRTLPKRAKRLGEMAKRVQELQTLVGRNIKRTRCAAAEVNLKEMSALSSKSAEEFSKKITRCKKRLAAPPSTIDD